LGKEGNEELKVMIPSPYTREYVQDKGITFTDFQKAAFLFHGYVRPASYFWK